MKYDIVIADPPWAFGDTLKKMKAKTKRSAKSQYNVMSVDEIASLDVKSISNQEHCVLALWVPGALLPVGLSVMAAWGFTYKQNAIWIKTKKDVSKHVTRALKSGKDVDVNDLTSFGMGRIFRQSHEIALIGTVGKVYSQLDNKSQRSVMFDVNEGHSIKTELLQDRLEIMFSKAKKIELFARRCRQGWATIGDTVTGKDIAVSIEELKSL